MDRHDQELLNKQLKRFQPVPRRDGLMMLAVIGVFLAGMTVGGSLFAHMKAARIQTDFERWNDRVSFFLEWNTLGSAIEVLA